MLVLSNYAKKIMECQNNNYLFFVAVSFQSCKETGSSKSLSAFCPQASAQKLTKAKTLQNGRPGTVGCGNAEVYFSRAGES